ncbi:MAG: CesT family type III secretion system chaperone [Planctomycetota bacterium]|jgi:type III secretion system chaperone SycN|nr:CesT family type III secretion system chaperone [Planctomycetota bacterium]
MSDIFFSTLADFGRRLGIPNLTPGANGVVELKVEKLGRLQLELDSPGEAVWLTLARERPAGRDDLSRRLLDLCHWRENHPWAIYPGARGGEWLLLSVRLGNPEFDLPTLERLLGYLDNLFTRVEGN